MTVILRLFITILMVILVPLTATATDYYASAPVYVYTSTPSTTVEQSEMVWGEAGAHTLTFTSVTIKTLLQSGDQVKINWYDSSGNYFDYSAVSGSVATITPPSGAYGAKLVLTSSSESGDRWAWWHSGTNSGGNTTYFPDPDTGGSGGGGTTVDLTPVVNELQTIQGQLTAIQEQLNTIIAAGGGGTGGDISAVVDAINSQTDEINTRFDEVTGQLSSIIVHFTTVQGQLDTIDSHVVDIYEYLSTPRTAQPISVSMPQITVDSTPPPIVEPYQEPYRYNRPTQQFELPPMVDSPGPLPLVPDPIAMAHDPPALVDQPREIDQPRQPDPVNVQAPRSRDPVSMDPPRAQDPPVREAPRQMSPVNRESPRTPSPVINRQDPVTPTEPVSRDAPLTPDPPLTPDQPL